VKQRKLAWWQLYLLVPIMIALVVIEQMAPVPGVSAQYVDIGIVALIYGLMLLWIHHNGGLLEYYYGDKEGSFQDLEITVYAPSTGNSSEGHDPSGGRPSRPLDLPRPFPWEELAEPEEEHNWPLN
jgi:hypothetical protein